MFLIFREPFMVFHIVADLSPPLFRLSETLPFRNKRDQSSKKCIFNCLYICTRANIYSYYCLKSLKTFTKDFSGRNKRDQNLQFSCIYEL